MWENGIALCSALKYSHARFAGTEVLPMLELIAENHPQTTFGVMYLKSVSIKRKV